MWIAVRQRFSRFHENLSLTTDQLEDGLRKQLGVRKSLHAAYWGESTETPHGFIVGSWGKGTAIGPPNDVDIFFELPIEVYTRFEGYQGNKQSSLLQEVRQVLVDRYYQTDIRGDGQVVVAGFNTIAVEVVPVFRYDHQGRFLMPDTNNGGRWKLVDPRAELQFIETADILSYRNGRPMAKMMKTWKRHCNVPLKSYQIEMLAAEFMSAYAHRDQDYFYYDWFVRDFLIFLCGKANSYLVIPGTQEVINLGDGWLSRAQTARDRAILACEYERDDFTVLAGEEWQKIFGNRISISVT